MTTKSITKLHEDAFVKAFFARLQYVVGVEKKKYQLLMHYSHKGSRELIENFSEYDAMMEIYEKMNGLMATTDDKEIRDSRLRKPGGGRKRED